MSHVKSDDGARICYDVIPEIGILIVSVLNNEDGVGADMCHEFFILKKRGFSFVINDDEGLPAEVVADAVELTLKRSGEMLVGVGIVGELLKKNITNEFVCPGGLNTKPMSVDDTGE